jgi:hypothetical protein
MSVHPTTPILYFAPREPLSTMIPGQRESGSLTRFANTPVMVEPMVDRTMDGAGRADRQREGGGAPGERRPARRPPRWTSLRERVASWRDRSRVLDAAPAAEAVALHPPVL